MMALIRWGLLPVVVVVLALKWEVSRLAVALEENCGTNCTTEGDIAAWQTAFLIALGLWILLLVVHFSRRRRRD